MVWLSQPVVSLIIGSLFMYIILLQMSQFYTQQAYGLWPQVWPVSDKKLLRDISNFKSLDDYNRYYIYDCLCNQTP